MISIIVPFKDAENWLGRCLESMTKQKGDYQFIIINDNSEDGGCLIAENYERADSRFEVYDNEHAAGVSGARNTGLDHAEGEFFSFLDADDELDDRAWFNYKNALGICADIYQFNHLRYYPSTDRTKMKYSNCEGWYDVEHLPVYWFMVWNKIYRTETLGHLRFVEGLQYGEDEIFNYECLDISESIYASREVGTIHHFDNKGSLSKTKGAKGLLAQNHAIEELLMRTKSQRVRKALLELLSEHWNSPTYHRIFADEKQPICE